MTLIYLDIAAVRIQTWLGRSRSLAGQRGASAALAEATAPGAIKNVIGQFPHVSVNTEAGDVDGVINLQLTDDAQLTPVIAACMRHLRDRLPALEFEAVWATGPDYLTAYKNGIKPRRLAQDVWVDLPAAIDFPIVASCERCRVGAATTMVDVDPQPPTAKPGEPIRERACADCVMRHRHLRHAAEGPEAGLRDLLDESATYASTFGNLARIPVRGAGDTGTGQTQLAVVYADGNAVGRLLDHVAKAGGAGGKAEIARKIDDATKLSLAVATEAIRDVTRDPIHLPVTPHIAAADDLLVSMPAAAGWTFITTYADSYADGLRTATAGLTGVPPLSVSMGMVFAHHTHPFSEVVSIAAELLRDAKRAVAGQHASVCWLDITSDGPKPLGDRPALRISDLTDGPLEKALTELAKLEASQRAVLARFSNHANETGGTERLRDHLRRLELGSTVDPFVEPAGNAAGLNLRDALSVARWWR